MESIFAAFLIGGCICAAFQVIGNFTKAIPPKILLLGIVGGTFAASLGIMEALGAFAGAGTGILVIGFGEAVFFSVQGALTGHWMGVIANLVVLSAFILMGVLSGAVRLALTKNAPNKGAENRPT